MKGSSNRTIEAQNEELVNKLLPGKVEYWWFKDQARDFLNII